MDAGPLGGLELGSLTRGCRARSLFVDRVVVPDQGLSGDESVGSVSGTTQEPPLYQQIAKGYQ